MDEPIKRSTETESDAIGHVFSWQRQSLAINKETAEDKDALAAYIGEVIKALRSALARKNQIIGKIRYKPIASPDPSQWSIVYHLEYQAADMFASEIEFQQKIREEAFEAQAHAMAEDHAFNKGDRIMFGFRELYEITDLVRITDDTGHAGVHIEAAYVGYKQADGTIDTKKGKYPSGTAKRHFMIDGTDLTEVLKDTQVIEAEKMPTNLGDLHITVDPVVMSTSIGPLTVDQVKLRKRHESS